MGKTIADRLREHLATGCSSSVISRAIGEGEPSCILSGTTSDCEDCRKVWFGKLADAIEAEQMAAVAKTLREEVGKPDSVSVGLLVDVATELEDAASMLEGAMSEDLSHWAVLIRKAVKRPEPEVLDADGAPIKVGDTVYLHMRNGSFVSGVVEKIEKNPNGLFAVHYGKRYSSCATRLTHRKPDTQEAIDSDAELFAVTLDADDEERFRSLLERQRKLLGGD